MSHSEQTCQLIDEMMRKYDALGCAAVPTDESPPVTLYTANSSTSGPAAGMLEQDGNSVSSMSGQTLCQRLAPVVDAIKHQRLDIDCDCGMTPDLTPQQNAGVQVVRDASLGAIKAPRCMPISYAWN